MESLPLAYGQLSLRELFGYALRTDSHFRIGL
jgi:hypothetical protein